MLVYTNHIQSNCIFEILSVDYRQMKIPKKFLNKFALTKKLEKYDPISNSWIDVEFDPTNEDHYMMRTQHYAEIEIMCVIESMNLDIEMEREIN